MFRLIILFIFISYIVFLYYLFKVFFITNIYMIIVAAINYLINANYLYICHKPGGTTLLSFFGPWPYYIIPMEIAALVIFFILYLPFIRSGKQIINQFIDDRCEKVSQMGK